MEVKIKIDKETHELIKKLAQDKNLTMNQLMIKLLEFGLLKGMMKDEWTWKTLWFIYESSYVIHRQTHYLLLFQEIIYLY